MTKNIFYCIWIPNTYWMWYQSLFSFYFELFHQIFYALCMLINMIQDLLKWFFFHMWRGANISNIHIEWEKRNCSERLEIFHQVVQPLFNQVDISIRSWQAAVLKMRPSICIMFDVICQQKDDLWSMKRVSIVSRSN